MIMLNVSLAVFNLLPFPPLDGSKVLQTFLPREHSADLCFARTIRISDPDAPGLLGIIGVIIRPVFHLVEYLLLTPWIS